MKVHSFKSISDLLLKSCMLSELLPANQIFFSLELEVVLSGLLIEFQ